MSNRFKKWEIALLTGLLVGLLSVSAGAGQTPVSRWQAPEGQVQARYQVSVFPFGVGQGDGETMIPASEPREQEYVIQYYFPRLWAQIRDAIGL